MKPFGSLILAAMVVFAADEPKGPPLPPALRNVGLDQRLNQPVPLDLVFHDEKGLSVPLRAYFGAKPVILALVYYDCPMLCTQILNGLVSSLKGISFNAGGQFQVIAVSFDPAEKPPLARQKKEVYLRRYGRPGAASGMHFLTGEPASIQALTKAVGFRYYYDQKTRQFAHASAIMVLTPQGKLSRYFYGVEYAPRDVRLALVEASENKIGTPVDQALLFCYRYDPATGKYSAVALNMVRLAGVIFVLLGSAFLFVMFRHDFRRDRKYQQKFGN